MATHISPVAPFSIAAILIAPVRAAVWLADSILRAHGAASAYERLTTLSDESLRARGLTRQDLPAAAYRSNFET